MVEPMWVDAIWVGGSLIGLSINGWVLHEASKDLENLLMSKINGQNVRDATAAQTQAQILFAVQAVICLGGAVRMGLEPIHAPRLFNKMAMSTAVVLIVTSLVSVLGVMDLQLRRQQLSELLNRKRGLTRTRQTDRGEKV